MWKIAQNIYRGQSFCSSLCKLLYYSVTNSTWATQPFSANHKWTQDKRIGVCSFRTYHERGTCGEKLFVSINEKATNYSLFNRHHEFSKLKWAKHKYIYPMMSWLKIKQSRCKFDSYYFTNFYFSHNYCLHDPTSNADLFIVLK